MQLAFALGPNYNKPWEMFDAEELNECIKLIKDANAKAKKYAEGATEIEKDLINAIQARVPKSLDDVNFKSCNEAYAKAMVRIDQA